MRTLNFLAGLFVAIAAVMAFHVMGAAEYAAHTGGKLERSLFYGPLYPLGASLAMITIHGWLMTASGQRWRTFRNERSCARRVAAPAFVSKPGYPDAMD